MLVWYAAYGSNLLQSRFITYLQGGPVPGTGRLQAGARDGAAPRGSRPFRFDHPLVFGQRSRSWNGGGVCFVDHRREIAGATAGRAWLVTAQQFSDVWAQENGIDVGLDLDIEALLTKGSLEVGTGWYRRVLVLGEMAGHPVVTFTCGAVPELNPGGPSYLHVVGRGLVETWGWSPGQAADYLSGCAGNAGQVAAAELAPVLITDPTG